MKEARYMRRDPAFKASLMNLLYVLIVAVFMVLPQSGRNVPVRWMVWPASFVALMSEMRFFFNFFGTEGAAASLFFLYPASRRQMLVGKNAVYLMLAVPANVALGIVLCFIANAIGELPYVLFWMLLATGFFVAAGNLMSVLFPMRVVMKGWKTRQQSVGTGCAYGFLYLGVSLATFVALAPVIAAIAIPRLWLGETWFAITLPLAIFYVLAAHFVSVKIGERLLLQREVDLMQKLGAEE
jgi:hypothetical protein